jgi:hypothetical protein
VRTDLRLAIAQNPRTFRLQVVTGCNDVVHLVAHVMNAASRALLKESGNWRPFAERLQQLDLGVGQFDENHRHAVVRLGLRRRHPGPQH